MSTTAIDSARTSERLTAFLSEIQNADPVDNKFTRNPTLDALMKSKKTVNGGRQYYGNIDSGTNTTISKFSDYDKFNTTAQDTARSIVYPAVNYGGSVVISWEELREIAGDDHKIYDLVKHKRDNFLKSLMDEINAEAHAATQLADAITSIPVLIDSTGTAGGLSASTDPDWAAQEVGSVGAFSTNGLTKMNNLYNSIVIRKANPSVIITTQDIYEAYEAYLDADVRYTDTKRAVNRGFKNVEFKGTPVEFDLDCASGVLYMWDPEHTYMIVDSEGDFVLDPFEKAIDQKAQVALGQFRGQLYCNNRRSTGKLTGITV